MLLRHVLPVADGKPPLFRIQRPHPHLGVEKLGGEWEPEEDEQEEGDYTHGAYRTPGAPTNRSAGLQAGRCADLQVGALPEVHCPLHTAHSPLLARVRSAPAI